MQVHYAKGRPDGDRPGFGLTLSPQPTPYTAGMLTFASNFDVPPGKKSHRVASSCCYAGFEPLHALAYRVHTHELGRCARNTAPLLQLPLLPAAPILRRRPKNTTCAVLHGQAAQRPGNLLASRGAADACSRNRREPFAAAAMSRRSACPNSLSLGGPGRNGATEKQEKIP